LLVSKIRFKLFAKNLFELKIVFSPGPMIPILSPSTKTDCWSVRATVAPAELALRLVPIGHIRRCLRIKKELFSPSASFFYWNNLKISF